MIKIAIILCLAGDVISAFDYRVTPPAALFPFRQSVNDDSLPDSVSNPAYLPRIRNPYLHCSGSRPYTLDGLYATTLRAGYAMKGFAFQALWDRFGIEQYLENVVELNLAYMPVRYISIGAGASYYNIAINSVETSMRTHQADCRASLLIAPCEWIEIAFQQENIASLFIKKRRDLMFPEWIAGAALKPFKGFSLLYNISSTSNGYVNTIAATANVLSYFSIRVGYAHEATTYSGALSFVYKYISVSYGVKYHPHLGFTHSAGVTLSVSEIHIDSLSYGSIFSRVRDLQKKPAVNINSCSLEQLTAVPGLPQHIAERIMKYRKTTGPLSRTALLQIGLSGKEIDGLLGHITGLAPDDEPGMQSGRTTREDYEKKQKIIFKKLIGLGIPAATALELTDMVMNEKKKSCADRINSLPGLSADKKKQVLELCAVSPL
jgi:hypothetical protein